MFLPVPVAEIAAPRHIWTPHGDLDLRSRASWPQINQSLTFSFFSSFVSELTTSLIHSISHLCSTELTMGTILFLFVSMFIFMRAPPPEETCARSSERYYILPHRVLPTGEPKPNWAVVLPGLAIGWGVPPLLASYWVGTAPSSYWVHYGGHSYIGTVQFTSLLCARPIPPPPPPTTYMYLSLPLSLSLSPGSFSLAMKHVQLP